MFQLGHLLKTGGRQINLRINLDGGLKIAQDAICTALEVNDNRVVDIHLVKRIDPLHPRIEIELEVLDDWSFEYERKVLLM